LPINFYLFEVMLIHQFQKKDKIKNSHAMFSRSIINVAIVALAIFLVATVFMFQAIGGHSSRNHRPCDLRQQYLRGGSPLNICRVSRHCGSAL